MKPFELFYLCAEPFLLPLHKMVRRRLLNVAMSFPDPPDILDVGGRKSHYTIKVPANITITDLPRETELQKKLHLGIDQNIIATSMRRRSNIKRIEFDDMTRSSLPDSSYSCVVAVEVLEHVELDHQFVKEVYRVLKPGGIFLMTTPNGDFVKNTNPDHKRHYRRQQLMELLTSVFDGVKIEYAVKGGVFRRYGLKAWSVRRPHITVLSMVSNLINTLQSSGDAIKHQARGTHHLFAVATKTDKVLAESKRSDQRVAARVSALQA